MAASGTSSLVLINDMTACRSSKMNSEVCRAIICSHSANAAKLIEWDFTVLMDNDPKHTNKAAEECVKVEKLNVLLWPSQSPDFNRVHFGYWRQNSGWKNPQTCSNWTQLQSRPGKHLQGGNSKIGDVHGLQTSGSHWQQMIFMYLSDRGGLHFIYNVIVSFRL